MDVGVDALARQAADEVARSLSLGSAQVQLVTPDEPHQLSLIPGSELDDDASMKIWKTIHAVYVTRFQKERSKFEASMNTGERYYVKSPFSFRPSPFSVIPAPSPSFHPLLRHSSGGWNLAC